MKSPLDWTRDGKDWPHREASGFITAGGLRWHVQRMGEGPVVLLLHGTGASTHSWRTILPLLARDFTVIAPDLPGHAFTGGGSWQGRSLDGMGRALGALLAEMEVQPAAIVGHSAGVAIALQLASAAAEPPPVIGYNPALMPFEGLGEQLFPAMAKLLLLNPLAPRIFAGIARIPGEAERFLKRATNSQIDAGGLACYSKLVGNSRHCEGALTMMASWDLTAFSKRLPEFSQKVVLIHGGADKAVPLSSAQQAAKLLPNAALEVIDGLGHLAHEEQPEEAAMRIAAFVADHALSDPLSETP